MSEAPEDRGDEDIITTGDEPGDTGDQTKVKVEDTKSEDTKVEDTKSEDKDEPRIPKSRFDQAVNKARAAEKVQQERADKLEAELAVKTGKVDFDKFEEELDKLEEDLEAAITDGNVEAKQRIRKEIRRKNAQLVESRTAAYSQHATAVAVEQITYNAAVATMEAEHPELNPDLDGYDEDKVKEVMEFKTDAEAAGKSSTVALKQALRAVYGNSKPEEKKAEEKDVDKAAADRTEAAVKKALETKKSQPADTGKAGAGSDKAGKTKTSADVGKMSDKEFDKMDEAEKRKARGDDNE
jgi:hypothetical protein